MEVYVVIRSTRHPDEDPEHDRELVPLPRKEVEIKVFLQAEPLPDPFLVHVDVRAFQNRDDIVLD